MNSNVTIQEMLNWLCQNTDQKVLNGIISQGFERDEAVELAYLCEFVGTKQGGIYEFQ